jgi:hypothetical protein
MLIKLMRIKLNNILKVVLVIFGSLLSLLFLKYFTAPYVWISLSWFFVFIFWMISSNKTFTKAVLLYISIIIFTFGFFEAYLSFSKSHKNNKIRLLNEGKITDAVWIKHDILGYAPVKNNTITSTRYLGDTVTYKVVYTIDSDGLRIAPPHKADSSECVLFFGCSYTYGEGVNDTETMPYLTGLKTNQNFRIYNFGFHGYGPHQMLSALEHGMVENIIKCKPRYAIYQALVTHIERSAGLESWDIHGPKYILNKDGEAVYAGYFDSEKIISPKRIENQLLKSAIFQKIWWKYHGNGRKPTNSDDIELFLGIVDKARRVFEARYPGSEFRVLFWDYSNNDNYSKVIRGLNKRGVRVDLVSQILPDINSNAYTIGEDPHPNRSAYEIIAEYVANKIVNK